MKIAAEQLSTKVFFGIPCGAPSAYLGSYAVAQSLLTGLGPPGNERVNGHGAGRRRRHRDPLELAKLRDERCKRTQAEIARALYGNWRDEHLFALKQAVAHNFTLLERMPDLYVSQSAPKVPKGFTFFQVFVGPHAAFEGAVGQKYADDFPDGTSKTILIIEGGEPVPWTKPQDIDYDPDKPLPRLLTVRKEGFYVALADGSYPFLKGSLSEATLRAAITRNGRDKLGADWDN
jgi:hypothetical protein